MCPSLFVRGFDEEGQSLCPSDDVAADDGDSAELADGARVRQDHAVQKAPGVRERERKRERERERERITVSRGDFLERDREGEETREWRGGEGVKWRSGGEMEE